MKAWLSGIFFLSGVSGLLFETLWFRQTGLAFGNGVWATSLVLSSFMAGLALGSALAARFGAGAGSDLRWYAAVELAIGAGGVGLVALLPLLPAVLAPLLRSAEAVPALLNALRFGLAFALLLVPSVAMGATLPLLTNAVSSSERDFGRTLGLLYGSNTLGAVLGAVAAEFFLIARFGVLGSAGIASALNVFVALAALLLRRRVPARRRAAPPPEVAGAPSLRTLRLLVAALLAGFTLLALEVVWFRILTLFVAGTGRGFALLLASVLSGLAVGGLLAAALDRAFPRIHRMAWLWALAAGVACVATYALFGRAVEHQGERFAAGLGETLALGLPLMGPVSVASGMLFTFLGRALREEVDTAAGSAGLLTLANTAGAALGPLVAGFVLLPRLGMEDSIFALSACYAGVSIACAPLPRGRRAVAGAAACGAAFCLALLAFPFGRMAESYLSVVRSRYEGKGGRIIAFREGLTETIQYARYDFAGEPLSYQLITNGFSMSATGLIGKRYMSLFVHLPVALHPGPRDALLISYGVGTTASALVETRSLERIDVVDISREILEMSPVVHGERDPLRDPRVVVHVEDGRHFLQTTRRRFDLITGEPPPPKYAGIAYLYTREYFELARERLRAGGMISYWLPVYQLERGEFLSVIAGFCAAFEDCSLWNGNGLEWILLGTNGARGPVDVEGFSRQWEDPVVARRLRAIGVERPEQLGALFIAGPRDLRAMAQNTPPLVDDFPLRLGNQLVAPERAASYYRRLMDAKAARSRFAASPFIARLWPASLREATLASFATEVLINQYFLGVQSSPASRLETLDRLLRESSLETLPLWLLGTDEAEVRISEELAARGRSGAAIEYRLGARELSRRHFDAAATHLRSALEGGAEEPGTGPVLAYALARAGRVSEAREVEVEALEGRRPEVGELGAWAWLRRRFEL